MLLADISKLFIRSLLLDKSADIKEDQLATSLSVNQTPTIGSLSSKAKANCRVPGLLHARKSAPIKEMIVNPTANEFLATNNPTIKLFHNHGNSVSLL